VIDNIGAAVTWPVNNSYSRAPRLHQSHAGVTEPTPFTSVNINCKHSSRMSNAAFRVIQMCMSNNGLACHWSSTQLQLPYAFTASHPLSADTQHCQDDHPQRCLIAAGLRQYPTARHVCHQPQQAASGTEHTDQALLSVSATELHRQLHWLPIRQRITYKTAVITYKTRTTGTPVYLSHLIHDN